MDISLKFVSKGWIDNIPTDNGLAPIRPKAVIWKNDGKFTDAYMHQSAWID